MDKHIVADKYGARGYGQLKAIIGEILDGQSWPSWNFLNGVLDCKEKFPGFSLWFHWGMLLIVPDGDRYAGKKAEDFQELDDWNTEADGTMTLIGKSWNRGE